jgi:hypothetical protein
MKTLVLSLMLLVTVFLVGSCVYFKEPPAVIYPNPKETPGNYKLDATGY